MKCRLHKRSRNPVLLLSALCLALFALSILPSFAAQADKEDLLETGSARRVKTPAASATEIKIISYNMRWRSGDDLRQIISLLRSDPEIGNAGIIGLQEADRNKKRSGYTNTARLIADELGMYYAWAAPPLSERSKEQEEETGVAILSVYPITDVERLVLPNEGPGGRHRVALGASLRIGTKLIRVYSVHGETRISTDKKLEQLEAVVRDLKNYPKTDCAVVLGDFNTLQSEAIENTTKLFTDSGFETPFPNNLKTWKTFIIELKLDWIWLKGLRPLDYGVDRKVRYSDHFPLWVRVNLDGKPTDKTDIRGRITKINRAESSGGNAEVLATLLVEARGDDKPRFDKAFVKVTTSTSINIIRDQERRSVSLEELRVGDEIEARFMPGPVLMSYPVQATAAAISIIR